MPRTIAVSVSPEQTDALVEQLGSLDGVVSLALQRGISVKPPGDILTLQATNEGTRAVLSVLEDHKILDRGSISTSQLSSLMSPQYQNSLDRESNETIWDEMAFLLRRETNIAANYLLLMGLSGSIAAIGLWSNTLHIVVGAMIVAPGFEPLVRIPFGWIGGPRVLTSRGFASTALGYLVLALGGALMFWILQAVDPSMSSDLTTRLWVRYWSSVTASGAVLAFVAGAAGAIIVTAQRAVLSAGVMVALALIPSMTIAGMALAAGNLSLAGGGLARWTVDAGCVLAASTLVLILKQRIVHRRRALS